MQEVNRNNPYSGVEVYKAPKGQALTSTSEKTIRYKPTRNRRFGTPKNLERHQKNQTIAKDPAIQLYFAGLANRRRNKGYLSPDSVQYTLSAVRNFLEFSQKPITSTTLSELIQATREQHRQDDFATDNKLLRFVATPPVIAHSIYGALLKGVFKANRCPLQASFNTSFTKSTRKISPGILKAIYESLDEEHRRLMDYQAHAGERVAALCSKITLEQFEDFDDRYTLILIKPSQTKARNEHVCIIPKPLADWIRQYAKTRGEDRPFRNYETLWRDITKATLAKFGIRLTSHYLRKRFHTIAGKTPMPVNSWDYLMGDKQTHGHNAGTYTLEDFAELVNEYDKYLVAYLSIAEIKEPDDPRSAVSEARLLEQLREENSELKKQILSLTKLLTEKLTRA